MGESNEKASWNMAGYRGRKRMKGQIYRRKPRRDTVYKTKLGVQTYIKLMNLGKGLRWERK